MPNIKWLENHKPLFSLHVSAVSTVHSQDPYLNSFFAAFHSFKPTNRKQPPANEDQFKTAVRNIIKARPEPLVAFLYVVLDKLFVLIANPPYSDQLTQSCFETICQLVKVCTMLLDDTHDTHGRSQLLITYIHYHKLVSEETVRQGAAGAPLASFDAELSGRSRESVDLMELIRSYEKTGTGKMLEENVDSKKVNFEF